MDQHGVAVAENSAVGRDVLVKILAGLGAEVSPTMPLALVHARDAAQAKRADERLAAAYRIGDAPPLLRDPVIERIAGTL